MRQAHRQAAGTERSQRREGPLGLPGHPGALRLAEVRSRAARLPDPGEIKSLEDAALARSRESMTPAEIRALAAEAIAHLHEVAGKLAELSALLGEDKPDGREKPLGEVELLGEDKP